MGWFRYEFPLILLAPQNAILQWSLASVFGPLYITRMREITGSYSGALHVIAGVMAVSILLPIIVRSPRPTETSSSSTLQVSSVH